jgi:hypothetical protein
MIITQCETLLEISSNIAYVEILWARKQQTDWKECNKTNESKTAKFYMRVNTVQPNRFVCLCRCY